MRHPLDPLTGAEIEAATSILKRDRHLKESARFVYVTLREPPEDTVLSYQKGQEPQTARPTSSCASEPSAKPTRPSSPSPQAT